MAIKIPVSIYYKSYPSAEATLYSKERAVAGQTGFFLTKFMVILWMLPTVAGIIALVQFANCFASLESLTVSSITTHLINARLPYFSVILIVSGLYPYYLYSLRNAITHMRCMGMCYGDEVKNIYKKKLWLTLVQYLICNILLPLFLLSFGGIIASCRHTELILPVLPISVALCGLFVFLFVKTILYFRKALK